MDTEKICSSSEFKNKSINSLDIELEKFKFKLFNPNSSVALTENYIDGIRKNVFSSSVKSQNIHFFDFEDLVLKGSLVACLLFKDKIVSGLNITIDENGERYFAGLYTDSNFQRKKLASLLIARTRFDLTNRLGTGIDKCIVRVFEDNKINHPASNAFERAGFNMSGSPKRIELKVKKSDQHLLPSCRSDKTYQYQEMLADEASLHTAQQLMEEAVICSL